MTEKLKLTPEQKDEFDKLYNENTTNCGTMILADAQDFLNDIIEETGYPHLNHLVLSDSAEKDFGIQLKLLQAIKDPSIIEIDETRYVVLVPGTEHSYYCTDVGLTSLETRNSKSHASRLTLDDIKQLGLETYRREQI